MNACPFCGQSPIFKQLDARLYAVCGCRMLPETEARLKDAEIVAAPVVRWPAQTYQIAVDILMAAAQTEGPEAMTAPVHPQA